MADRETVQGEDPYVRPGWRRWSRRRVIFSALLTLFLIVFAIVWSQRIPIAGDYIDREFARRGVPATYNVKRISFGTQRIENLVIGDPRRPDLTARAVELKLTWSLTGPDISLITARGVLMRGRVVNGKLSLGSVDKLLPPPTGAPFSLPDQAIDVADAAMALDTPAGRLGLAIEGKGNLSNGFVGKVAGVSRVLMVGGCAVEKPVFYVTAAISKRRPAVKGPLSAARVLCPKSSIDLTRPRVNVDANFSESVNAWKGNAALDIPVARLDANIVGGLAARVGFDGNPRLTRGDLRFATAQASLSGVRAARLAAAGRYALSIKDNQLSFVGAAEGRGISAVGALQPAIAALSSASGTPLNPIGDGIAAALARAGSAFDAKAGLRLINGTGASIGAGAVRVETLDAVSRSGARLSVSGGNGLTYYWPLALLRADGNIALSGGGLPTARLSVSQSRGGGPVQGVATIAPMAAGSARLSLTPVRFSAAPNGLTAISTVATVDGPFNDGRVLGLVVPVSGRFSGTGGFAFGERCTVVTFRYLEAAGLRLGPSRLPMCPTGRALLWRTAGGTIQGGAAIDGLRLSGRLGQAPITLASSRVRLIMDKPGFDSRNVAIRLGKTGSVTRFDMSSLSGQFNNKGVRGVFAGGKGKIGNVPLLMSDARGRWSVERGDAVVDGSMLVSDEADPPRFYPLVTNDFHLTLIDGEIDAKGWLDDPQTGTKVTQVTINHVLKTGSGNALLDVPGIRFDENYQPEELTRLTTGVVALVEGVLKGQGEIKWTPRGSTSTGVFSTEKMNLAALVRSGHRPDHDDSLLRPARAADRAGPDRDGRQDSGWHRRVRRRDSLSIAPRSQGAGRNRAAGRSPAASCGSRRRSSISASRRRKS